jgi:hypothetical protein
LKAKQQGTTESKATSTKQIAQERQFFLHDSCPTEDASEEDGPPFPVAWSTINPHKSRTIPQSIDPETSACPDIVRLLGLPRGAPIPRTPTKKIKIQIIEIAYAREGHIEQKVIDKIRKYEHLLQKYARWGWDVDPTVRVIIIGHRGGIPNITHTNIRALGLSTSEATSACRRLSTQAVIHFAKILRLSRIIEFQDAEVRSRSAVGSQIWKDQNAPT